MRVWMVFTVLAPIGGIESALLPLALDLKARGHDIGVYLIDPIQQPNQNAEVLSRADIPVVTADRWLVSLARLGARLRQPILQALLILASPLLAGVAVGDALYRRRSWIRSFRGAVGRLRGALAERLTFEPLYYQKLGIILRASPPDVVHVHGWGCGEDPPGALEWLRHRGHPIVYTEHNSPDPATMPEYLDAPMNVADVIIAVSQAAAEGLIKVGHASRPIKVIPYGIERLQAVAQRPAPAEFVVSCVARLQIQKGHAYLLQAFSEVITQVPGAQLRLAGDGELREELEDYVNRLGLSDKVKFLGKLSRSELPELYSQTDVVVLASLWEGLPVTLIEALSAGMPIVATNVGGNAELVVDGDNGLLVPPRDPTALAAALIRLAKDSGCRGRMGEASRRRFEAGSFSPQQVTDSALKAYQQAIHLAGAR